MNDIRQITIIDDEEIIRNIYEDYVNEWAKINNININLNKYSSSEAFLFSYEIDKNVDILLLDVEMGKISGLDLAKKIRKEDENIQIIFISGYGEYIGYGYEVDALNFLLKPVKKEKLFEVLDKSLIKHNSLEKSIIIKTENLNMKIFLKNIYYIQNDKNYIEIFYNDEILKTRMTMKDMQNLLDDRFHRLDRSVIVNIEKIKSLNRNFLTLNNDIELQVANKKFEEINRKFIEYF